MLRIDQKIVIVTRATQLASLRQRFATRGQAKFQVVAARKRLMARAGAPVAQAERLAEAEFAAVVSAAETYDSSVDTVRQELVAAGFNIPIQVIDREFLPNFVFGPGDVIVTIGQDGLVANTAKYVMGRPIVAINPDPQRFDGVLLAFTPDQARGAVAAVLRGKARFRKVTLARATLDDGQELLAFNELFIGCRTHVSARYSISLDDRTEPQSSSGLLVSTGAGSTGWLSSVLNMAAGVTTIFGGEPETHASSAVHSPHPIAPLRARPTRYSARASNGPIVHVAADPAPAIHPPHAGSRLHLSWDDPRLAFVVREPFISKTSRASIVAGMVEPQRELVVESEMATDGVIFSDGVESDYLEFNAGAVARVTAAPGKALLVAGNA